MKFRLSEIADWIGTRAAPVKDQLVDGYSIDTRTIRGGDLFFALRGPARDGHDYIAEAFAKGACAAVASSVWSAENRIDSRLLAVEDPLRALGELAGRARRRWGRPLAAVTGSNGKTTTKDLIAAVLETKYRVAKSEGNLNNGLGLPLSLLRFDERSEVGVAEMGMNHAGEIGRLADIAAPSVGVVTNVNAVHLEHFSSVDEIALAKRELIEKLPLDGTAVLNGDDPRLAGFPKAFAGPAVTFGIDSPADFRAVEVETLGARGVRFRLDAQAGQSGGGLRFESRLPGRHNVSNILGALAAASVLGVDAEDARESIAAFRPPGMRGECLHLDGVTILYDCYNSNPKALAAMLAVLRETPAKRRVAVLGEMLELGPEAAALHHEIGEKVADYGIDLLVAVGGWAREFAAGAVSRGFSRESAFYFEDAAAAGSFLARTASSGDAVLLKASRGVGLERAWDAWRRRPGGTGDK